MPLLMSFVLETEIATLAWIDNASVQFPLNIYARGSTIGLPDSDWNLDLAQSARAQKVNTTRDQAGHPDDA